MEEENINRSHKVHATIKTHSGILEYINQMVRMYSWSDQNACNHHVSCDQTV